jgi:nitroreductase
MERRSVRKFEPRPVDPERARILLECGFAAPSSKNLKPCHIMLIDDPKLLKDIGSSTDQARVLLGAPLAVAVCVDVAHYETTSGLTDGTWMEDSSCVMMNVLLAARALGLEGVWLQIVNRAEREDRIPRLLGLPDGVKLFAIAVLGFPAVNHPPHSGVDDSRLHTNGW